MSLPRFFLGLFLIPFYLHRLRCPPGNINADRNEAIITNRTISHGISENAITSTKNAQTITPNIIWFYLII